MSDGERPFRTLGWHLKLAREQLCESLAEVSGAVEIESEVLVRIEEGKSRPSEDVLMLLISHFALEDSEANSLWELAGYISPEKDNQEAAKNVDLRIMYTDMVHITVNDFGVVMNFLQANGLGNQPLAVSRVGMSKDQAQHMLSILQQTLDGTSSVKSKMLPPKNQSKNHRNKN